MVLDMNGVLQGLIAERVGVCFTLPIVTGGGVFEGLISGAAGTFVTITTWGLVKVSSPMLVSMIASSSS